VISATPNTAALEASYRRHSAGIQQSVEKLSTGKRINRPKDDPAGFMSAEKIRSEIVRLRAELKVIGRQRSATRQEQSLLKNIQDQLTELQGLLVGAADGLLTAEQRELYSREIDAALKAVQRINDQRLEQAANIRQTVPSFGDTLARMDRDDLGRFQSAVEAEGDAVSISRAGLAAYERYELDVRQRLTEDAIVINMQTLSMIEDVDVAEEASNLATSQVLAESALMAIGISQSLNAQHIEALLESVDEVVE
jgi:flagellin-like hook-associated protein FlgL